MDRRHQLWAIAHLLLGRYGKSAKRQAAAYAALAAQKGDRDSQAIWKGVAGALREEASLRRDGETRDRN
ncbi:hypothetical protein [Azospirillum sp. SYSU D00513]|uniref:hypothetical protein n=1 Tax=Azospirillum sp. SYSU D00513 TaxID=2812561 RepID=UPI001A959283|nr:hypothetical protein [Azospirillum sp. SYSU D00513]